jgi:predicted O-methyltransferase YrrM
MAKFDLKSLAWYLKRPGTYSELINKSVRAAGKVFGIRHKQVSTQYADCCCTWRQLVKEICGTVIEDGREVAGLSEHSNAMMLYNLAEYLQAERVIETGVAMGNSSLGLLRSLSKRNGRLISSDIPNPDKWVQTGSLVTDDLRPYWELVRLPDRKALPMALKKMPSLDLCYYDSDKSYSGRMFGYALLWNALRDGGIFVSDDIGDNRAFEDFCTKVNRTSKIVKSGVRYVGVILKS